MRRVGALLLAAVLLTSCGTISSVSAMRTWVTQSNFRTNLATVTTDVHHSASALRDPTASGPTLHTVCAVLFLDLSSAGASLPAPDNQASALLGKAYIRLQSGANACYGAEKDVADRAKALALLAEGYALLVEAKVRVDVASASK